MLAWSLVYTGQKRQSHHWLNHVYYRVASMERHVFGSINVDTGHRSKLTVHFRLINGLIKVGRRRLLFPHFFLFIKRLLDFHFPNIFIVFSFSLYLSSILTFFSIFPKVLKISALRQRRPAKTAKSKRCHLARQGPVGCGCRHGRRGTKCDQNLALGNDWACSYVLGPSRNDTLLTTTSTLSDYILLGWLWWACVCVGYQIETTTFWRYLGFFEFFFPEMRKYGAVQDQNFELFTGKFSHFPEFFSTYSKFWDLFPQK